MLGRDKTVGLFTSAEACASAAQAFVEVYRLPTWSTVDRVTLVPREARSIWLMEASESLECRGWSFQEPNAVAEGDICRCVALDCLLDQALVALLVALEGGCTVSLVSCCAGASAATLDHKWSVASEPIAKLNT